MPRRILFGLLLVALPLVMVLSAGGAKARGTLDQSNTATPTDALVQDTTPTGLLAETFTAGRSGQLDTATLYLQAFTPGTVTVGLFATDGSGAPTTPLATTTGTVTEPFGPLNLSPSQYTAFTFAAPATVVAGQKYGLVIMAVHPDAFEVAWAFQQPPSYAGGQGFGTFSHGIGGPFEPYVPLTFDFQTFVTPPATPTASISGVAQAGFTLATSGCGTTNPPAGPVFVNSLHNVVVTAIPCSGSHFTGWTNGPCAGTTINPCDISPYAGTVTANFAP